MACDSCWGLATPPQKHSYLVQLANDEGESFDCIVQTPCVHDIQEWVTEHAESFPIANPRVINVDDKAAAHVPIVESVN